MLITWILEGMLDGVRKMAHCCSATGECVLKLGITKKKKKAIYSACSNYTEGSQCSNKFNQRTAEHTTEEKITGKTEYCELSGRTESECAARVQLHHNNSNREASTTEHAAASAPIVCEASEDDGFLVLWSAAWSAATDGEPCGASAGAGAGAASGAPT